MPKKFIPDAALLNTILTRYKETNSYAAVSRETGLSAAIIKRIITENTEGAAKGKEYIFTGIAPKETFLPTKAQYYYQIICLMKEHLNV